jgi:ferric-dicitrate binding protein FerR (iron transport regulator)
MSSQILPHPNTFAETAAQRPANLIEWQSSSSGTRWERFRDSGTLDSKLHFVDSPFQGWGLPVAIALGLFALGALWFVSSVWRVPSHVVTATGEQQDLTLTDGSMLHLNSDSEARIALSALERRVILVRGEAHFAVANESERPFLVSTPQATVKATGTVFNVQVAGKKTTVSVLEGSATILPPFIDETPGTRPSAPTLVPAGARALVTHTGEIQILHRGSANPGA